MFVKSAEDRSQGEKCRQQEASDDIGTLAPQVHEHDAHGFIYPCPPSRIARVRVTPW
jgi:hypothetical protein